MSQINYPKIYNPASQTKQELIDNFVVRTEMFKEIFEDIKNSEMKDPEQYYIIQGVRGQGKTTLLLRIAYEIEHDSKLRKKFIPVIFNEEQYNITKLYKLWETVASYMDEANVTDGLYDKMQKFDCENDHEYRCFSLLEKTLKDMQKKIILFIDNIDEMLSKFSDKEHHRLREVFIESSELRIIGASSVTLEFHHDYGKAFYQFFKIRNLRGLNTEETKTLLLTLGKHYKRKRVSDIVNNQPERIEALRRITGGVIRTIVILFDIFVDDNKGNAFMDLEKILDLVSPLYKHRMEKLPPQQQEIVDFIALRWDAVSTKEISQYTKIESKAVSAQLKKLEKYHIVEREKTNTKNYLYLISERFFNIWYLMRHGRKWDEKRVRFLVEFLQIWCDKKELEERAHRHLNSLKQNILYDKHALYFTEALVRTSIKRELQHQIIVETRSFLNKQKSEMINYLTRSDFELTEEYRINKNNLDIKISTLNKIKNKTMNELFILGYEYHYYKKDFDNAEKYYLMAADKEDTKAMVALGLLYKTKFKNFDKAEKYYLMAADKENTKAMVALGLLYETEFKDLGKAEKYYLMAVKKEDTFAMIALGLLYHTEFKDFGKAEKYYLLAVEGENKQAVGALGLLYHTEFKDFGKAEKYYLMAVERENTVAMGALGLLYHTGFKDFDKAEKYYLMAVEKENTVAMFNLGLLHETEFKDFGKAEKYYLMAVERENTEAMVNVGLLYETEFKDFDKAKKYYLMAVERESTEAMVALGLLFETEFKDFYKVEKYYLMAADKENTEAMNSLAWLYFTRKTHKQDALRFAESSFNKERVIENSHTYAMISLWSNEFEKVLEASEVFLNNKNFIEESTEDLSNFLLLLIAKKQYHLALKIFTNNPFHLKDRLKLVYYALMSFMKVEYPNEYLKMGSDLKQTVDEIINKINQLEIDYK